MKTWLDLIIPLVLIVGCLVLIGLGIDGEVKTVLGMAAIWTFKSVGEHRKEIKERKNGN